MATIFSPAHSRVAIHNLVDLPLRNPKWCSGRPEGFVFIRCRKMSLHCCCSWDFNFCMTHVSDTTPKIKCYLAQSVVFIAMVVSPWSTKWQSKGHKAMDFTIPRHNSTHLQWYFQPQVDIKQLTLTVHVSPSDKMLIINCITTNSCTIWCGFLSECSVSFGKKAFNNICFSLTVLIPLTILLLT